MIISLTLAPRNNSHRIWDWRIRDQYEIPASASRFGKLTYKSETDKAGCAGDENHKEDYSGGDIYNLY